MRNIEKIRKTLKESILDDNGIPINAQRTGVRFIKKQFPEAYDFINNELQGRTFQEKLYKFINEINVNKCKQCGEQTKFKTYREGYNQFCSRKCINIYQSENKEFASKISKSRKRKFNDEYYIKKYGYKSVGRGLFDYNNEIITGTTLNRILNSSVKDSSDYFRNNWNEIKDKVTEQWLKRYMPKTLNRILKHTNETEDLQIKKYMFLHKIKEIPLCEACKEHKVSFSNSGMKFNKTCYKKACTLSTSNLEREIYEFIKKTINGQYSIKRNFRIDNNEIDIYIKELNLGIEINGLYWHSENFKDKYYHLNKKNFFKEHEIIVKYIWEDDWNEKQELVKSMIKNWLGKTQYKIYGRKTIFKELTFQETNSFLHTNHLRGNVPAKYKYGLFYDNKLVSVMTIGKSRFEGGFELLRFANKMNYSVIGGFSKLLKHITKLNNINKLLSYANYDISEGNVYKTCGFKKIKNPSPNFYWVLNKTRFSRQSKWRETKDIKNPDDYLRKKGYYKIWDSGNFKYKINL